MINMFNRASRRQPGRRQRNGANVVINKEDCCTPPETLAEELYAGTTAAVLVENCCDGINGCVYMEASTRCEYWPSFAHPRWLTCAQLHNKQK